MSPTELLCGLAVALLLCKAFVHSANPLPGIMLPLQTGKSQQAGVRVATITFTPDIHGVCRRLFFDNDTGHFEAGGTMHCYRQCDETCFPADTDPVSTAGIARAAGKPKI
jgi:hypothetical protein